MRSMRQLDLSQFTQYYPDPPALDPEPDPDPDYVAHLPVPQGAPVGPLDIDQSLAVLEAAHAAATAQNNTDWPDNDSQRATNQHFIDVLFGQKKSDVVQAKSERDQAVAEWLGQSDQVERPPLRLWAQLGPSEKKAVDGRLALKARAPTDGPAVLSDAMPEPLQDDQQIAQAGEPEDESKVAVHDLKKALHEETPEERAEHHEAPLEIQPPPPIGLPGLGPRTGRNPALKSGLTPAEQLAINRSNGAAAEKNGEAKLKAEGLETAPQVTVKTENGTTTRLDFVTRDPETGEMGCVECKASPSARFTPNQLSGFPEISKSGGTIVGKGKPGFPGGTKLPAKAVRVMRDPDKGEP
jgi:hypothetical protein